MIKIAFTGEPGDYVVWAMLDDGDDIEPHKRRESFVIGNGETPEAAYREAHAALAAAQGDIEVMASGAGVRWD